MRKTLRHFLPWVLWAAAVAVSWPASSEWEARPAAQSAAGLACNDTIHITLNEQCQALLTPDQLLEGDPGCLQDADFEIQIFDNRPDNGPVLDGYGVFAYQISRRPEAACPEVDFTTCWGYIRAEDKTPPKVTCPPDTAFASRRWQVQLLGGSLGGSSLVIDLSTEACLGGAQPEPLYYELHRFKVTEKGVYVFELQSAAGMPVGALYQEEFNPRDPCKRQLAVTEAIGDGSGYFAGRGPAYRLTGQLLPGHTYVLFAALRGGARGEYLWAAYTNGQGRLAGVPVSRQAVALPLFCENIDSVHNNKASVDYLGRPTASDNCDSPQPLGFTDRLLPAGECDDQVIERTFTFRDKAGNRASCTQRIAVRQPALVDVILPPKDAFVACDDDIMLDADGHPHPMVTGRPFLLTAFGPLFLDTARCGLGAVYQDNAVFEKCGDTRLIHRVWTIVNWCRAEEKLTFSQSILVGDYVGPSFECPAGDKDGPLFVSTGSLSCFASFEVPLPQDLTDNCSETWTLEVQLLLNGKKEFITFPAGTTDYLVSGVPTGEHILRYIARDACENETVRDCSLRVADDVAPVAVCNDKLRLSIGGDGRGSITAADVDEGSWDNCDPEPELEIRRVVAAECVEAYRAEVDTFLVFDPVAGLYYTPWRKKLDFICCEVGTSVRVELRATDEGLLSNTCWLDVPVEDKLPPRCLPPDDRSIPCDSLLYIDETDTTDLQAYFGRAGAGDNCEAIAIELPPRLEIDNCGTGAIVRRFQAVDPSGNRSAVCEQTITLTPRHNYEIRFPQDAESYTCDLPDADTLALNTLACDVLAVDRDTSFFEAEADECYKMVIRYRVLNWCEYKNDLTPFVVNRDEDGDGIAGNHPVFVLRRPPHPDSTYIDKDNNEYNGYLRTVTSHGYWEYTQVIKVYDNTPPQLVLAVGQRPFCALNSCSTEIDLLFEVVENCAVRQGGYELQYDEDDDGDRQDLDVNLYIKGRYPKQRISGMFPIGKHSFYLTAFDGCGNRTVRRIPFEVVDCKPPAPVCIERLAAELMPVDFDGDGIIDAAANTVWATDFIASESVDCSNVRYSINRKGLRPHPDSVSITVTCADPDILPVEIYAWDDAYNPTAVQPGGKVGGPNYSHCDAVIYVQDNRFNLCNRPGGPSSIAGRIRTEKSTPVAGVDVRLSGADEQSFLTGSDGAFLFPGLRLGHDYTIVPHKDSDPINGVSTFDLVQIAKHILGVQSLGSPFRLIAADANRSGSVTTLDLIQLRKLILGIDLRFANNTSWRFLPADYAFPDPANPWKKAFPEVSNLNNFGDDLSDRNFTAVKVGDVNGSAVANNLAGAPPRALAGTFILQTDDANLEAGQEYAALFTAPGLAAVQGFQFTLNWDPDVLDATGFREGLAGPECFALFPEEGMVTASWISLQSAVPPSAFRLPPSDFLFALVLRPRIRVRLRDALQLTSRRTPAEAYNQGDELLDVKLDFRPPPAFSFTLQQNQPNPFRATTVIGFTLPAAGAATLRVYTADGKMAWERRGEFPAGYNEVELFSADLPPESLLFYTLETAYGTATRKMVHLR